MRFLLLGADGQLGYELHRALAPLGPVVPATISAKLPDGTACARSDFTRPDDLTELCRAAAPDWIVNAAAYTVVDRAEEEATLARTINADAVATLAAAARRAGAGVLHYSTDYVFPGRSPRPWREDDPPAPINAYGATKLEGERALAAAGCKHLVLRTAWVYGARGHNFLLTMLKLARVRDRLTVVDDQHGTPTPSRLLAGISAIALARLGKAESSDSQALLGTYHATALGDTTWCGFAREIVRRAHHAGLIERAPDVQAIASADFPTPAKRPAYSVLDCSRLMARFGLALPDWRDGLQQVVSELVENRRA